MVVVMNNEGGVSQSYKNNIPKIEIVFSQQL